MTHDIIHGILPVWKPKNWTSHDVVVAIRRLTGQKKVGHTGTLDPAVTGVLPICIGKATRVVEYVQELSKTYEGTLILGIATDTQDQEGRITEQKPVRDFSNKKLQDVMGLFTGEITQIPPMYSAVKIKGRRLYEWAREGKEVERKARRVTIEHLECLNIHDSDGEHPRIDFRVKCSKGTYIRTLCVDIGQALGYPAHMSHLVRIESGPFTRRQCATLNELEDASLHEWKKRWLLPLEAGLIQFPSLTVSTAISSRVANGRPIELTDEKVEPNTLLRIFSPTGFIALYKADDTGTRAVPVKVFAENR